MGLSIGSLRFGKSTHISMISNSVAHLRSYTNSAIADIAGNSAPISPVTPSYRRRLRIEPKRRRLHIERRRLRIERRYRRIESPLEFFFHEQSYSSLHSGRSLAWDHVRGDTDDPYGAIADFWSFRRFLRSCRRSLRRCHDRRPRSAAAMRRRRSLRDSINIIKHC